MTDLENRYTEVLLAHMGDDGEASLLAAFDLGQKFQVREVSPDQVVGFHYEAIERLVGGMPEPDRGRQVLASFKVLLEVMIAYGLTHADAIEQATRARQRKAQIAQLQELDRLKDQFLGILSHELRTPLNAIMGFSSLLADEVLGPLSPSQAPFIEKILASAEVMLRLVGDLLDMSRVQAGKFTVDLAPMDFTAVTHEVIARMDVLARANNQSLHYKVEPLGLLGDRLRIGQIITNLITNAIKFTPKGGTITVRAHADERGLLCEVEDTGIGIEPGDLSTIFARFTQLDMSSTRPVGGAGLGLNICQALVACHGGTLGVRSKPGEGSTFWFTLPLNGPVVEIIENATLATPVTRARG